MKHILFALALLLISSNLFGQRDSTEVKKLDFTGDFRFRIEQDWNSINSNGIKRNDRSRLRYRFRFGVNYSLDKYSSFGGRLRSGNLNDQQGPHVTIGGGTGEFSLIQIGFEKLFYQYKRNRFTGWVGKNDIPIYKLNELFWNDNVFPEGIGLKYQFININNGFLTAASFNSGHFIIKSNNQSFGKDSYLQVAQLDFKIWNNRINFFPGIYAFRNIGNLPDGKQTFDLDYTILHLGCNLELVKSSKVKLGIEYYFNVEDYSNLDSIPSNLKDQKKGFIISAKYGHLKKKGDWLIHLYYANLQKYAIVDYFAQNDWVRWDYSSIGATGSRISNFEGIEIRLGYAINEKFNLILRSYFVEELVNIGSFKENGSRIRLDLNIGF